MAGKGERFGEGFKPFRMVGDEYFITAAARPFCRWESALDEVVCAYLAQQEGQYLVSRRIGQLVPGVKQSIVTLPEPTTGPVQTLIQAIERAGIGGAMIACDCDHSVDVSPLMVLAMSSNPPACAFPIWPISDEEIVSWSVAKLDPNGRVVSVAEKSVPAGSGIRAGIIGCYYFRTTEIFRQYAENKESVSGVINDCLASGEAVTTVPANHAEFFGDPKRLANTIEQRKSRRRGRNADQDLR
jgi:hypothetical protein